MRKYGLLGYPLGHSFSKTYFNQKFEAEKIDAEYVNFEIPNIKEIKNGAEYCGMSSLMTTTMMVLKNVIDNLQENDIRNGVVVMVGGAPVTQAFADKIGADIYSETAFEMMKKIGNEESSGSH